MTQKPKTFCAFPDLNEKGNFLCSLTFITLYIHDWPLFT